MLTGSYAILISTGIGTDPRSQLWRSLGNSVPFIVVPRCPPRSLLNSLLEKTSLGLAHNRPWVLNRQPLTAPFLPALNQRLITEILRLRRVRQSATKPNFVPENRREVAPCLALVYLPCLALVTNFYAQTIVEPRVVGGDYESMLIEHIEITKTEPILFQRIACRITFQ